MTVIADSNRIFADAHMMYQAAIERLSAGDIHDASEKAWCSTKRATDALILARTGEEPPKSPDTTRALRRLAMDDPNVWPLQARAISSAKGPCTAIASTLASVSPWTTP